jgi:DNA-binding transcriptional ArsR family regulator
MIAIHIQPEDIVQIRFAYSPLIELVKSYRVLQLPELHGRYQAWVDAATVALGGTQFPHMDAVMTLNYCAQFLMPTPLEPVRDFADEIASLGMISAALIRQEMLAVLAVNPLTPVRQSFLDGPRAALECLIGELIAYWERTLAIYWRRMIPILENDILHQAKSLALNGAAVTLDQLAQNVAFDGGMLRIDRPNNRALSGEIGLNGNGIQLVPSIFKDTSNFHGYPHKRAMVMYSARGGGLLEPDGEQEGQESLRLLVGEGKARILLALEIPLHTQELAQRLGVTASAISQHLGRLQESGMVEAHRSGYYVYYRLSHRGQKLLELFAE